MTFPVFFSGGSAIANLAHYFAQQSIPTGHIITTFDNGGSTAEIRRIFGIPAIGDIRNRILALATDKASSALIRLLKLRLDNLPLSSLERQFNQLISPSNPNWKKIPCHEAALLREALQQFNACRTPAFNLANASIGNLVLLGLYLLENRVLEKAIGVFSRLAHICGEVAPIATSSFQLGALLADGRILIGQNRFKTANAKIIKIFLKSMEETGHDRSEEWAMSSPHLSNTGKELIKKASMICYAPGSYFSSLLTNFLVRGAGKVIAENPVKKIMIPNSGHDPELGGRGVAWQVNCLLDLLRIDFDSPVSSYLDYVLVDLENGVYPGNIFEDIDAIERMGIRVIDRRIVARGSPGLHMPRPTAESILETGIL